MKKEYKNECGTISKNQFDVEAKLYSKYCAGKINYQQYITDLRELRGAFKTIERLSK
jgi:hypothetical protein